MEDRNQILTLHREMDWLQSVIDQVIRTYLVQEGGEKSWLDISPPSLENNTSPYAELVRDLALNTYERLALSLVIAPQLRPEALDVFFGKNQLYDRGFSEFGGLVDSLHSGFLPTGQTLCFIITANNPELRFEVNHLFSKTNRLIQDQILILGDTEAHLADYNGVLCLGDQWLDYFMTGQKPRMQQGVNFPAQLISTEMDWEDVVLNDVVLEQLEEIVTWINHGGTIMNDWGLRKMIKPGYRALFYGPPGTGKTLTVTLLGKVTNKDVYKIDLSMIVSKYIGETEKNLARIFDIAQNKDWILFFDEADAMFGKRTEANSSNDRYANQQTSYLLQRIEDFPGTVILASNLKANMDDAFTRRFQTMINFPMPTAEERQVLWQNAFDLGCQLHEDVDLTDIAESYEMAGGAIINVLRYCALKAVKSENTTVRHKDILSGIRRELQKENKTLHFAQTQE